MGVHEGPQRIAFGYSEYEEALADGMFLSDEPGYYKPGDFGIRIENDMEVVLANISAYDNTQFLRFNTITLVPYERSLIDVNLLTNTQIDAINQYHQAVSDALEPLLVGEVLALNALRSRTQPLAYVTSTTSSTTSSTVSSTTSTITSSTTSSTTKPDNKTAMIISSPILIIILSVFIMLF